MARHLGDLDRRRFVTQSSKPLSHALMRITIRGKFGSRAASRSNLSSIVATIGHKGPSVLIPAQ